MNSVSNVVNLPRIAKMEAPVDVILNLARKIYERNFFPIWTREVVQNSVDAKAKNIYITTTRERINEKYITKLTVVDDGIGMDEKTIHDAFLTLGGSYKEGDEITGGFGIAKVIVIWGNTEVNGVLWKLITRDNYVDSSFLGKKPVEKLTKQFAGTKIEVYRQEDYYHSQIIEVLENCNVSANLFYNGLKIKQLKRATKKGELSWCNIFYKKSCEKHQKNHLIVRVNGIYQFSRYISSRMPGAAIVEVTTKIKPSEPNYPLTPSREQFREDGGYLQEMRIILEQFNQPDIIRENDEPYVFQFIGGLDIEVGNYEEDTTVRTPETPVEFKALSLEEIEKQSHWEQEYSKQKQEEYYDEEYETRKQKMIKAGEQQLQKIWHELYKTHLKLHLDFHNRKIDTSAHDFYNEHPLVKSTCPKMLVKRQRSIRRTLNPYAKRNIKIMFLIKALAETIFKISDIDRFDFIPGWLLSNEAKAEIIFDLQNPETYERNNYLLINPEGLGKFGTPMINTLLQRITHELIHYENSWHDEKFVIRFHDVMERFINPNLLFFSKLAKEIL